MSSFKENWEKVDEICPNCNQITKKAKGITRQNVKYFFWHKPNFNEYFTLFIIIMMCLATWAYRVDTQTCRDYVQQRQAEWNNMTGGTGFIIYERPNQTETNPFANINFSYLIIPNKSIHTLKGMVL